MRFPAALVLASLDDPADTATILAQAKGSEEPQRSLLYSALASRPRHAAALLDAVTAKKLPRSTLTPAVAEKIRALGDEALSKKLDGLPAETAPPAPAKRQPKKVPSAA